MATRGDARRQLDVQLRRWVAAGILQPEQADRIRAHEATSATPTLMPGPSAPRSGRVPVVAEALGYLGGVLAAAGLLLVVGRSWVDMALAVRLSLSGAAAVLLLAGGAFVRERSDPALARLRWSLWTASTAATALFAGVLTSDGLGAAVVTVAAACAGAVALQSGLLWQGRNRPLQQFAFLASIPVLAGTTVAGFTTGAGPGLAVWGVGVTTLAVSLRDTMRQPSLGQMVGSGSVVAGGIMTATASQTFGLPFMVLSAFALLALAGVRALDLGRSARVILRIVGGAGLLLALPGTLVYFADGAGAATGLATWAAGGALVFLGARRRVLLPLITESIGALAVLGGAALTGVQWPWFAPIFGALTAIAFVALGMIPGQVLMSAFGSLGLLVNVPWLIVRFFPGEERAPLLISVAGLLIIAIAIALSRMGGRFRRELAGSGELHSLAAAGSTRRKSRVA